MHPYSVDSKVRGSIKYFFIILSALIFFLLEVTGIIEKLINIEDTSQVIAELSRFSLLSIAITPIVIYKFLFCLFDKWIWKFPLISKLTGIPNLNGSYKGILNSSFDEDKDIIMELHISQTFTGICFVSTFGDSNSNSSLARIRRDDDFLTELDFIYENQSNNFKVESGHHTGVNQLNFHKKDKTLEGRYFNDRGVQPNKGRIKLQRID
ncbi:MAG: hypothetical protein ABS862_08190 [Carnobacterium inhibens]|uniref:Cap15 family cyclic dinucleotide receptor domain-containing protein n=1 Tax=Carnobacterium sp. TaxID=48221 RepID=UPI0033159350